jgi:hypothetical protein
VTGDGISGGPNDGRASGGVSRGERCGVGATPDWVIGPPGARAIDPGAGASGIGGGASGGEVRTDGPAGAGAVSAFEPRNAVDAKALRCGGGSAALGTEPWRSVLAKLGGAGSVRVDGLDDGGAEADIAGAAFTDGTEDIASVERVGGDIAEAVPDGMAA